MSTILLILLAAFLAPLTYLRLEARGPFLWAPMLLRTVAWGGLATLLVNPGCPASPSVTTPIVLLDGSLSMGADTSLLRAAADSARAIGPVRWFGDERPWTDSVADRGRSDLGPALASAAALGRRVVVVTDGEIGDLADLSPELLGGAGYVVLPRPPRPDLAVTAVRAPPRATVGDSLVITAELAAYGTAAAESVVVVARLGARVLGKARVGLPPNGPRVVRLPVTSRGIPPGRQFVAVELAGNEDGEPRDDRRLVAVDFAASPGLVMLAAPGDWDARFLFRTLREVADLPVKGFVQLASGDWNDMDGLAPVSPAAVDAAARGADLLVLRGSTASTAAPGRARGVLRWPQATPGADEWYLAEVPPSPISLAFLAVPRDSMPPLFGLRPLSPEQGDWTGLTVQAGRRGTARPAIVGRQVGRRRELTVGADGFWRWAFRGGPSGDAYRAMVASSVAWLLSAPDSGAGRARVIRPVVEAGMPIVFERLQDSVTALAVTFDGGTGPVSDTLRFGGDGRATAWFDPGVYRYRFDGPGGGSGTVAVDSWSREWLPHPVVVENRPAPGLAAGQRRSARQWPGLYLLVLMSLAGEWFARRRLGLR